MPLVIVCIGIFCLFVFFSFLLFLNAQLGHSHLDSPESMTLVTWEEMGWQCEWFSGMKMAWWGFVFPSVLSETLFVTARSALLHTQRHITTQQYFRLNSQHRCINVSVCACVCVYVGMYVSVCVCVCVCVCVHVCEYCWSFIRLAEKLWRGSAEMGRPGDRVDLWAWTGECGSSLACC